MHVFDKYILTFGPRISASFRTECNTNNPSGIYYNVVIFSVASDKWLHSPVRSSILAVLLIYYFSSLRLITHVKDGKSAVTINITFNHDFFIAL